MTDVSHGHKSAVTESSTCHTVTGLSQSAVEGRHGPPRVPVTSDERLRGASPARGWSEAVGGDDRRGSYVATTGRIV